MNILLTGCCGFIGYSVAQNLLKQKNIYLFGVDNINNYYSKNLKKKRLKLLQNNKNFLFIQTDINNKKKILKKISSQKIDCILHFAAQAGVRYAVKNPKSYIHSNVNGFKSIISIVKKIEPKSFIFASSSSVYGDAKKYPVTENDKMKPKNLYAKTKKFNEIFAFNELKKTKTKIIGLRLFTIYGEWGRPDMLIFKFLDYAKKKKIFELNNNGEMFRDFTYIKPAVKIIQKLIFFNHKKNFNIFNICSSQPIKVSSVIKKLATISKFSKIKKVPMNKLEVFKTYGSNKKVIKYLNIKNKNFLNFNLGLKQTANWFKKFHHLI
jgi:UDP-glucuronate 4-epimerase